MPLKIKTSSMKYKDEQGNMQELGIPVGGVSTDSTLTKFGVPADAKAVGNKFSQLQKKIGDHSKNTIVHVTNTEKETWNNKSNFSGSYNDLNDKPTVPTVPTSLKNPYKLTISLGDSSYTYDGSEAVSIAIEDGSEVIY